MKSILFTSMLLSAALVLLAPVGHAQEPCIYYEDSMHWAGMSEILSGVGAIDGEYAFIMQARHLLVVDISTFPDTHVIGSILLADAYGPIVAQFPYVYVTDLYRGLQVVDVSDPSNPVLRSAAPLSTSVGDLALGGSCVYATSSNPDLLVIDVFDPDAPTVVATVSIPGNARAIAFQDNVVYVASDSAARIWAVDVSVPTAPEVLSGLPLSIDVPIDIATDPDRAVLVTSGYQMALVDISNPAAMAPAGQLEDFTYITAVAVADGHAFVSDSNGLSTVDIPADDTPSISSLIRLRGTTSCFSTAPGKLYLWTSYGLQLFGVPTFNPTTPIAHVGMDLRPNCVALSGMHAFIVTDPPWFIVFDITDPRWPNEDASIPIDHTGVAIRTVGDCAYLAVGTNGLKRYRITNPHQPAHEGTLAGIPEAVGLFVQDDLLLVAGGSHGLYTVDVSSPHNPTVLGTVTTVAPTVAVCGREGYAFVAEGWAGIQIFDIGVPEHPVLVRTVYTTDSAVDACCVGSHVYVPVYPTGIDVIDATTPSDAVLVGHVDTQLAPSRTIVSDGMHLYVAVNTGGVEVFDLTDPASPRSIGLLLINGGAEDIAMGASELYTTGWMSGLCVGQLECRTPAMVNEEISPDVQGVDLRAYPNPSRGPVQLDLRVRRPEDSRIFVCDASGRVIRELQSQASPIEGIQAFWDGRDDAGRELPAGVYFTHVTTGQGTTTGRVVLAK